MSIFSNYLLYAPFIGIAILLLAFKANGDSDPKVRSAARSILVLIPIGLIVSCLIVIAIKSL